MKSIKTLALLFVLIAVGTITVLGIRFIGRDQTAPEPSRKALKSLPYLDWHPVGEADINKAGVTIHEQDRSYAGLNLYNYDGHPEAYLMDMSGVVLHTWSQPTGRWHHVELLENGDLLVIVKPQMLLKLDRQSKVKWSSEGKYHHDVAVADNGDICALRWDVVHVPHGSETIPIANDYITILASDGTIKKDISIFELFGSEITEKERDEIQQHFKKKKSKGSKIEVKPQTIFDVFHTNTVEIIESDIGGLAKKGDVLICIRNLNIVAIIDVYKEEIVWRLNANHLDMPHQPSIVDGNILVFDNGYHRKYSRVIEIDPFTGDTIWEYTADPKRSFFSFSRGGCQRLPNGNTLITESNKARVFEVTPQGKIVWEFYGTETAKARRRRRPIYRMTRLAPKRIASTSVWPEQD